MTPDEYIVKIKERFGEKVKSAETPNYDMAMFTVDREDIPELAKFMFHYQGGRFVVTVGTDYRERDGDFLVDHVFSLAPDHMFVTLRCRAPEKDLWVNSITGMSDIPAANWAEREIQDLLGIKLKNHPDPRRLIVSDDWPDDIYPLRRDVPHNFNPPSAKGVAQPMAKPPKNATVVPIGPFFPVLEEPSYWRLFVEGEKIVGGDYRGFYSHRGIEKIADSQLNYNQVPFIAERICGI